jgi:hypothetical protein
LVDIKVNLKIIKNMEKGILYGRMVKLMRETGNWVKSMDRAGGEGWMGSSIMGSGVMARFRAMAYIHRPMVII